MDRYAEMVELQRKWEPPAGLERWGARPVGLTGKGIAFVVFAVGMFAGAIAAVIGLSAVARNQAEEHRLLRDDGRDATGRITRHWRDSSKEREPMVAYEFEWDGRTYAGRSRLPLRMWQPLEAGSPIAVRFLPGNPKSNRPRDWEGSVLPAWLPFPLGAALVAGGVLMLYSLKRRMHLLSEGRPAPGVVTRYSRAEHGQKNVHYEFCLLGGGIAKGRFGPSRKPPQIGATICVVYERDNPRNNARYPMDLVKLER